MCKGSYGNGYVFIKLANCWGILERSRYQTQAGNSGILSQNADLHGAQSQIWARITTGYPHITSETPENANGTAH